MKRLLPILLCLCLLLSLAGCHGARAREPFRIPEEFDTSREYTITFWAKNDTNKNQTKIYENAIREFESLYPNIHVNIRMYTDYSRIYNDVITNISTGTTPNVCITYPDHIATYLTGSNVVVPLDELMENSAYGLGGTALRYESPRRDEIIEKFLQECRFRDHYYAIPFMRSTEACYVNRTFVEKLGYTLPKVLTWEFIWEVSEAAMAKNPDGTFAVNGQNVMIPFIYKSTDNMMIQMTRQLGSGYSGEDGQVLLFNDTTRDILLGIAGHVESGAFSTFKISSYPANFLNAGQCIFAIDSTAGSTWMGTHAPLLDISEDQLVEFETVVMPIPQYDPANPQMISQGPSVCVFNKEDPQEVLASWIFAQYLLTNKVQIAYSETEGYVPVTYAAQNSPEYREYFAREGEDEQHYEVKLAATRLLLENIDNTFVTPVYNGSASLRGAAGQLIEETAKSVRRKQTVDNAYIDKLFSDIRSLYRLDQISVRGPDELMEKELGALPAQSKALLISLGVIWFFIAVFAIYGQVRQRKNRQN